jgi:hypothetical protein
MKRNEPKKNQDKTMLPPARQTLPPLFCRANPRSEEPILINRWVSFLIKVGGSLTQLANRELQTIDTEVLMIIFLSLGHYF